MASEAPMSRAPALLGALGDTPELNEMGSGVCVCMRGGHTRRTVAPRGLGHAHLRCVSGRETMHGV